MTDLLDFICNLIIEYFPYIILAIMLGVNKAVGKLEEEDIPFTVKNILKYSIVFSIIAPLKVGFDIKTQINKHAIKVNEKKEKEKKEKEKKDT